MKRFRVPPAGAHEDDSDLQSAEMGANIVIDLSNTLKYESTGAFTRKKKSDAGQRSKEFDLGRGSRAEDRSALANKTPDLYE